MDFYVRVGGEEMCKGGAVDVRDVVWSVEDTTLEHGGKGSDVVVSESGGVEGLVSVDLGDGDARVGVGSIAGSGEADEVVVGNVVDGPG